MDITETIAPKSDQLNADDLITGPRTVTITDVKRGDADQPVNIITAEFGDGRPFKPCKSMRRVLVAAWGSEASTYTGRRMTLYRDEAVRFGGQDVGGIRISHMSHIDHRLTLALTVTRGKRAPYTVEPLPDTPPRITAEHAAVIEGVIAASTTQDELDATIAELKAWDLGKYRESLRLKWIERQAAIAAGTTEPGQDGGNAADYGAEPSSGAPRLGDPRGQEPTIENQDPEVEPITEGQVTSLGIHRTKWCLDNEKTRADWFDWVASETGHRVDTNKDLTKTEAHHLITLLKGSTHQ